MNRLKTFRNTALALACTLLAFSCSNEDDSGTLPAGDYPMTFSGSVEQSLTRSSSANSWDGGESVAIRIGSEVKEYTATTSNMLISKNGITPFYWQNQAETKTVTGWYPYSSDTPNSWSVKADQSNTGYQESDLLYAPATNIPFSVRNTTQLKFYHQTAKVVINIINADAATNPSHISSVKIGVNNNLALSGNYTAPAGNNSQGTWSNLGTFDIVTPKEISSTGTFLKSYAALVLPQDMSGNKFIAVTLSNGNTHYYIPNTGDGTLAGGKQYTYNITVKNSGITVVTSDITDWTGANDVSTPGTSEPIKYQIGDYYPYPDVPQMAIGIVIEITDGVGYHGKIVSLDQKGNTSWGNPTVNEEATGVANIRDQNDGQAGTRNLIAMRKDQSDFATTYAAFNWIYQTKNKGDVDGRWYMPAMNEMQTLYNAWDADRTGFNSKIANARGNTIDPQGFMWTSSEVSATNSLFIGWQWAQFWSHQYNKDFVYGSFYTRAIAKFKKGNI